MTKTKNIGIEELIRGLLDKNPYRMHFVDIGISDKGQICFVTDHWETALGKARLTFAGGYCDNGEAFRMSLRKGLLGFDEYSASHYNVDTRDNLPIPYLAVYLGFRHEYVPEENGSIVVPSLEIKGHITGKLPPALKRFMLLGHKIEEYNYTNLGKSLDGVNYCSYDLAEKKHVRIACEEFFATMISRMELNISKDTYLRRNYSSSEYLKRWNSERDNLSKIYAEYRRYTLQRTLVPFSK